jgi:hypothetical protein
MEADVSSDDSRHSRTRSASSFLDEAKKIINGSNNRAGEPIASPKENAPVSSQVVQGTQASRPTVGQAKDAATTAAPLPKDFNGKVAEVSDDMIKIEREIPSREGKYLELRLDDSNRARLTRYTQGQQVTVRYSAAGINLEGRQVQAHRRTRSM